MLLKILLNYFSLYLIWFGAIPTGTQKLLLALHLSITSSRLGEQYEK